MITALEYADRMARLQRQIVDYRLDAFVVSAEESIYYLTGVSYRPLERPFFIVVWPASPATLLVPALEQEHLRTAPNVGEVRSYWDYPSPPGQGWAEQIQEILPFTGRVGIEPSVPHEISQHLPGALFEFPLIEQLRVVKSAAEVDMLRTAAHYADLAMAKVIGASYYGVSILELFSQGRSVQTQIIKETDYDVLTTSVLAGAWPARLGLQPHGVPAVGDRLQEGPHIALSLLRVNGYSAECERTFFLAPPSTEAKAAYVAMREARRRAFALVRPGARCAEIDRAANGYLREQGYGKALLHRTGHGFGLGSHEGPWVADGSDEILQENMLISIEPGLYLPGVGGIRHSDTVLVTRDGYELLTRFPTDLDTLTITAVKPFTRVMGAIVRRAVNLDRFDRSRSRPDLTPGDQP